jgi:hypothetical protein
MLPFAPTHGHACGIPQQLAVFKEPITLLLVSMDTPVDFRATNWFVFQQKRVCQLVSQKRPNVAIFTGMKVVEILMENY